MSDAPSPINWQEVVGEARRAVHMFRGLKDLEAALDAAAQAEQWIKDCGYQRNLLNKEIAEIQAARDAEQAKLDGVRNEAASITANAKAQAKSALDEAKAKADNIVSTAEKRRDDIQRASVDAENGLKAARDEEAKARASANAAKAEAAAYEEKLDKLKRQAAQLAAG